MRTETDEVLMTPLFRRSPVLSKLLRFLLEQTLNNQSDKLKSYTVAVDGLGRASDFDASHDSYARVQMVRLRKLLESHYAQHGPVDRLCIYLNLGSYTLHLGTFVQGYPRLYRPLSDGLPDADPTEIQPATFLPPVASESAKSVVPPKANHVRAMATTAMLIGAFVMVSGGYFAWQRNTLGGKPELSPVLAVTPLKSTEGIQPSGISLPLSAQLADGLQRFKLSRVRVDSAPAPADKTDIGQSRYRLDVQLGQPFAGSGRVFLQLSDMQSNTLFWTREAKLGGDGSNIGNVVAPLAVEINGPYGAIAAHDTLLLRKSQKSGYPCLLKYFAYLKSREQNLENQVSRCLEKPLVEDRLRPDILAVRAFFQLERTQTDNGYDEQIVIARQFARRALDADPNSAYARFAMARLAYFDKNCVSARYFTKQALDANPNEPIILAVLASHAHRCEYPDAREILDRALLINGQGDTYSRLFLILATIAQKQPERMLGIQDSSVPEDGNARVNYYLSEALMAAARGNTAQARTYWANFSVAISPDGTASDDEKLRHIILSKELRAETLAYLTDKRVSAH